MTKRLRKRCEKCGWTGPVRPRERRCKQPVGLLRSYACWGTLRLVARPKPATRPQDVAARKFKHAERMVKERTSQMARLATSLRDWQRKMVYYGKRAAMSDAEIEAERARAEAAKAARATRRVRRGIDLQIGGG